MRKLKEGIPTKIIRTRIPADDKEKIIQIAKSKGSDISNYLRMLITSEIKKDEREKE